MPMHDSSMGTLEHRLEAQPSHGVDAAQAPIQAQAPQAAGYNAWVHEAAGRILQAGAALRLGLMHQTVQP